MGKEKGNAFERHICKALSEWWSNGERDDLFWRTSSSGGRATNRAKKGKSTANHCGDICATDVEGQSLLDLVTVEIKKGYNSSTLADLLDKPERAAKQTYEKWIDQAKDASTSAKTPHWLLIVKRDKRDPIVILPSALLYLLVGYWEMGKYLDQGRMVFLNFDALKIHAMKLALFLERVKPDHIRDLVQNSKVPASDVGSAEEECPL